MPSTGAEKLVHVAVGVILGADRRILIAKRADHLHQGGLWEFPGGKVEAGESLQDALARELHEELGITIDKQACKPLLEIRHRYSDKSVFLDVWWVKAFSGEPHGKEGQPLKWVDADALQGYAFPEANREIVVAIQRGLCE